MKTVILRALFLVLLVAVRFCSALSQVVETPNGRLEFVGLERWDIATIEQRLGYESLEKVSCNLRHDLTGKLGFGDAHCVSYVEEGTPYKVITVLEPNSTARIRYMPEPTTLLTTPRAWNDLVNVVDQHNFLNTIVDYGSTFQHAATRERLQSDEDEKWFALLQERRSEQDFKLALDRLSHDGDYRNRTVAGMVLMNFGQHDSAWHALVGGLRDSNEIVRVVCVEALMSLVNYTPRKVDWSASTSDLNLLLNGTNLFAYPWVIEILIRTRVSRKLASPLLKGEGGRLLLAYLRASHSHECEIAHDLLARLSGKDFGFDGERWREWLATIS